MTIKDQLQKYQGEIVKFTLSVEEGGQPISKTGRVRSCEDDHVAYIDGILLPTLILPTLSKPGMVETGPQSQSSTRF